MTQVKAVEVAFYLKAHSATQARTKMISHRNSFFSLQVTYITFRSPAAALLFHKSYHFAKRDSVRMESAVRRGIIVKCAREALRQPLSPKQRKFNATGNST